MYSELEDPLFPTDTDETCLIQNKSLSLCHLKKL